MPYYVGHDDDNDAGLSLIFKQSDLDLRLSFIKNEELGNSSSTNRFSTDVVSDTDKQQFNELTRLTFVLVIIFFISAK